MPTSKQNNSKLLWTKLSDTILIFEAIKSEILLENISKIKSKTQYVTKYKISYKAYGASLEVTSKMELNVIPAPHK